MKTDLSRRVTCEPTEGQILESSMTLSWASVKCHPVLNRLEYLSAILSTAPELPAQPILLWRDENQAVRHRELGKEIQVGRQAGATSLSFENDKLLSRHHFVIKNIDHHFCLEDLNSHNGTAVNDPEHRVSTRDLLNGDFIFAGNQTFVFLDEPGVE